METSISLQDSKDGCRNTITVGGVPKIRGTIFRNLHNQDYSRGSMLGPPVLGNYLLLSLTAFASLSRQAIGAGFSGCSSLLKL